MRHGPVHYFTSFAYLLQTACKTWDRGDETHAHFSTCWEHVSCRACRERKPRTAKEHAELDRLTLADTARRS